VFWVSVWVAAVLESARPRSIWPMSVAAAAAALAALTRPDGMLLALTTAALIAWCGWRAAREQRGSILVSAAPFVIVVVHLLWRRAYYGEWLPNTYYAKYTRPWPGAGLRYTLSFIYENCLFAWAAVGGWCFVRRLIVSSPPELSMQPPGARVPVLLIAGAFLVHVAYYSFLLGGDHFEYRAYAHLVIPLLLTLVAWVVRLGLRPLPSLAVFALVVIVGQTIPWIHQLRSRGLQTRAETYRFFVPVASAFPPGPWRAYARHFEILQRWLSSHLVCTRQQEHKVFYREQQRIVEAPGLKRCFTASWETDHLGLIAGSVGMEGWLMPQVAIIDEHGLTDWVGAHTPAVAGRSGRLLAHERELPSDYVRCFGPAKQVEGIHAIVHLTDDRIRDCESTYRARRSAAPDRKD
jgi:arabinofuranosyltransferase